MVTAGVFLVARFFPLFEASNAMDVVAIIGAFTAVFAATMALVANDIKRVLAYSTISQLGYMMFALGIGAYAPAIFHLFTHAFFKAGLFLAAGSVHHASGTFNMRFMGGLRRHMKWTYATMVIGSLSLAGIFPLSGFWSKDEILATAAERGSGIGYFVLAMGLIAAVMTAFYMFRAIFMTFHGEYRGGAEAEAEEAERAGEPVPVGLGRTHLHESPWVMVAPLVVLAAFALVIGFLVNPLTDTAGIDKHAFASFVVESNEDVFPTPGEAEHAGSAPEFNLVVAVVSSLLAASGIVLAYAMYITGRVSPEAMGRRFSNLYRILINKYYIDELYEDRLVTRLFYRRVARSLASFDMAWIDNINIQLSKMTANVGRGLANVQNGQTQVYAAVMAIGVVVVLFALLVWG